VYQFIFFFERASLASLSFALITPSHYLQFIRVTCLFITYAEDEGTLIKQYEILNHRYEVGSLKTSDLKKIPERH